jgi:hypothetical protein
MRLVGHLKCSVLRNWASAMTVLKKDLPSVKIAQVMRRQMFAVKESRMMWTSC